MKSIVASEMIKHIEAHIRKLGRRWGDKDMMYSVTKVDNKNIRLATDGLLYELIFDPSSAEWPYLMKEAAEEFGHAKDFKMPNAYKYQEDFKKMLNKYGWGYELYGGGIIDIFKEDGNIQ